MKRPIDSKEALISCLTFLDTTATHRAQWLEGKRPATGAPELWTHFEIAGRRKYVRMPKALWQLVVKYVKPGGEFDTRMFIPNTAGRRLLNLAKKQAL